MKFIPNSHLESIMLKQLGLKNVDDLFSDISSDITINELDLPRGSSQQETEKRLKKIADKNKIIKNNMNFLGGGIKPHYIPSAVKALVSRSEFYTAYTPYQSEASQGFLQAMFEYQSMIAKITGMEVANCSLYDGVTALSEAALMCMRVNKKNKFIIPNNISWDKKCVLKNYSKGPGLNVEEINYDKKTGKVDLKELEKSLDENTAGVYIENPNYFGVFEDDAEKISKIVKKAGALFVVGVDPVSLGVVKSPGIYGADIVIGEGRAFGNPMDYGGSSLGIFSCKKDYLRQMPGRVIGLTSDFNGRQAFCMSMQTREQHIRRGRATSNICTNEGFNALTACIYLSWIGGNGLQRLSNENFENGQKLADCLIKIDGFEKVFSGVHFNELVIKSPVEPDVLNSRLIKKNIHGGLSLEKQFPELKDCMLFGVTEVHNDEDIKTLVTCLEEVV